MSDREPSWPAGWGVVLPYRVRATSTEKGRTLTRPELEVVVANDQHSAGFTLQAWLPSGGVWPSHTVLMAERWANPVESLEEAVGIALRGLQAYSERAGYPTT